MNFFKAYIKSEIPAPAELNTKQHGDALPTTVPGKIQSPFQRKLHYFRSDIQTSHSTAKKQIELITEYIGQIGAFLITAFIKPRNSEADMPFEKPYLSANHSYYYVMITLWYLVKNQPECIQQIVDQEEFQLNFATWLTTKHDQIRGALWDSVRLPSVEWLPEKDLTTEICLLKWYHYGSVLSLLRWSLNKFKIPDKRKHDVLVEMVRLHNIVSKSISAANIAMAAKISSKGPYVPRDEITDRLSFLAGELDADKVIGAMHYKMDAFAIRRIRQREYTKLLNPGTHIAEKWDNTDGPWELHALCHHSRLKVSYMDGGHLDADMVKTEIERFRRRLCPFLTTEGSIMSTWERKYLTQCEGWFRSEVTCVIASTLLDISRDELSSQEIEIKNGRGNQYSNIEVDRRWSSLTDDASTDTLSSEASSQEYLSEPSHNIPPMDWTVFRPPHSLYPRESLISLDDTEEHYKRKPTEQSAQFRRLPTKVRDYLESHEEGWTKERLKNVLRHKWISVIDIFSNSNRDLGVYGKLRLWEKGVDSNPKEGQTKTPPEREPDVWTRLGLGTPERYWISPRPSSRTEHREPKDVPALEDVLSESVSVKLEHLCRDIY